MDQGPTVTVSFRSADGLEPGKTKVKFKDVDIGLVRSITLSRDLSKVLVTIDMSKEAERFTVADTRFWVVQVHGWARAACLWPEHLAVGRLHRRRRRQGRGDQARIRRPGEAAASGRIDDKGTKYTLHGESLGSIDVGSPIFYRRIQVGQVVPASIWTQKGHGVQMTVFVNAPYDQYVGKNTRWWHASGVDVRLDSNGFKVNTQSLAALAGRRHRLRDYERPEAGPAWHRPAATSRWPPTRPARCASRTACRLRRCCISTSRCAACRPVRRWISAASCWVRCARSAWSSIR